MSHKSFWDQDLNVLIDTIENNSKIGSHSQLLLRVNNAHCFKKESEMRHTNIIPYVSTYLPGSCNLRATFMILVKFILFCLCIRKTASLILEKFYGSVKRPLILITTHIGVMRLVCQGDHLVEQMGTSYRVVY